LLYLLLSCSLCIFLLLTKTFQGLVSALILVKLVLLRDLLGMVHVLACLLNAFFLQLFATLLCLSQLVADGLLSTGCRSMHKENKTGQEETFREKKTTLQKMFTRCDLHGGVSMSMFSYFFFLHVRTVVLMKARQQVWGHDRFGTADFELGEKVVVVLSGLLVLGELLVLSGGDVAGHGERERESDEERGGRKRWERERRRMGLVQE